MSTPKLAVLALLALLALAQTTMAQDDDMMDMDMDDEEMRMRMMSSDEMMDEVEEMEDRQDGDWSFRADASTPGPAGAGGRVSGAIGRREWKSFNIFSKNSLLKKIKRFLYYF
jgi:hypothetical protein